MSPEQHDRLAAYSQGVTHYVGRVLRELELEETPIDTQGFKILRSLIDQTCNDSWELFRDLQLYNPYTRDMRERMEAALEIVNAKLVE
jgi:prephenate dehydrogenase